MLRPLLCRSAICAGDVYLGCAPNGLVRAAHEHALLLLQLTVHSVTWLGLPANRHLW